MDMTYLFKWVAFLAIQYSVEALTCVFHEGLLNCTSVTSSENFRKTIGEYSSKTEHLLIHRSNITGYLTPEDFKDMKNMKTLTIHACSCEFWAPLFQNPSKLDGITIKDSHIMYINKDVFSGLAKLKTLNITSNWVGNTPVELFDNLRSLTSLDYSRNTLQEVKFNAFRSHPEGLSSLTHLSLNRNDLRSLEESSFRALNKLEDLTLENNLISRITSGAFAGLFSLISLNLGANEMRHLPAGVFQHTPNLNFLHLGNNQLTYLERPMFRGLKELKGLFLQSNWIRRIDPDAFDGFKRRKSLKQLYLFGNKIEYLPGGIFEKFDSLNELVFDGTDLLILEHGIFHNKSEERILALE